MEKVHEEYLPNIGVEFCLARPSWLDKVKIPKMRDLRRVQRQEYIVKECV